jgi:hypothetical protein
VLVFEAGDWSAAECGAHEAVVAWLGACCWVAGWCKGDYDDGVLAPWCVVVIVVTAAATVTAFFVVSAS